MSECVYEKAGPKKYRLMELYFDTLKFGPPVDIDNGDCVFLRSGSLLINAGYCWDGPSGPAIDTDNFMDGSLVHDMLYQLMREGHLKRMPYRLWADNEMFRQCKKDKMNMLRRCYTWLGVRLGGYRAAGGKL